MGSSHKKRSGIFNTRRRRQYKQAIGFSFKDTKSTDMGDSLSRSSWSVIQHKPRVVEKLSCRKTVHTNILHVREMMQFVNEKITTAINVNSKSIAIF